MKVILLFFLMSSLYADKYEQLRAYKEQHRAEKSVQKSKTVLVSFEDINKLNFDSFEAEYALRFSFCIADGICAFTSSSEYIDEGLIQVLKRDKRLKSVQIYNQRSMKTY